MKIDDLIPSLVPYENYEGTMVLFDIITDEYRNTLVKLLAHAKGGAEMRGSKKLWQVNKDMITTWLS
jgi:hypothetical protein